MIETTVNDFKFLRMPVLFVFVLTIIVMVETTDITQLVEETSVSATAPLGCHKRIYTYRVTQSDSQGHECWDNVSVMSCWGRCDSNEISDWKFPYKRSHHPVCVHATRSKAVAILRHCHPLADPIAKRYEYMEASSCHCQTCSTTDTNCEAPKQLHNEGGVKVLALGGIGAADLEYE